MDELNISAITIYILQNKKKQNKKTKPKQTNRQCLKSMKCSFK